MACCCGYLVDGHCLVVSHFQVLFLGVAELCPEFLSGVEHFLHFEMCVGFGAAGEVFAVEGGGEDFLLAVVADIMAVVLVINPVLVVVHPTLAILF